MLRIWDCAVLVATMGIVRRLRVRLLRLLVLSCCDVGSLFYLEMNSTGQFIHHVCAVQVYLVLGHIYCHCANIKVASSNDAIIVPWVRCVPLLFAQRSNSKHFIV